MQTCARLIDAVAILSAVVVGWVFSLIGMPLGWLVGAMLATAVASLAKIPIRQPKLLLNVTRAMIGTMLGASFTLELVLSLPGWWPSLAGLAITMTIMFVAGFSILRKLTGLDRASSALCAIPGGIAEMILLSENAGADQRRVAITHALRIALTILAIPIIIEFMTDIEPRGQAILSAGSTTFGDWSWIVVCILMGLLANRYLKLPAPLILVPMVCSAIFHLTDITHFQAPELLTVIVQIVIGINVGGRFSGVPMSYLFAALGIASLVVVLQLITALTSALIIAEFTNWSTVSLLLAYAPGGLAEMSLMAISVGDDVAFVSMHHLLRVIFALLVAPVIIDRLASQST